MAAANSNMLRVSKDHPCVVCGKDHWCGVSRDGQVAVCMRVESQRRARNGGWVHRLDRPIDRSKLAVLIRPRRAVIRCDAMQPELVAAAEPGAVADLAARLGVSEQSLHRLGIGYSRRHGAWTFPMRDAGGAVIGFRTRTDSGEKRAITGSRSGLFIPEGMSGFGLIIVCEGPTDTAAAVTLGFEAVGRPSCRGQEEMLAGFVAARTESEVWILADRDEAGRSGAEDMADLLTRRGAKVKVFTPPRHKDIRAWLNHGATHNAVRAIGMHRPLWRFSPRRTA